MSEIREAVRERYTSKAKSFAGESAQSAESCCGPECCSPAASEETISCGQHYESSEVIQLGMDSSISLGCGNPLLLAELKPGETVLDLGRAEAWTCSFQRAGCRLVGTPTGST